MFADCREIIHEVSIASNLEEALAILVGRVKGTRSVDAFAIYLTGAEAGQYVLKASDSARPEPTGHVRSGVQAGLLGLVGKRRELVVLNNAPAHPRYTPAAETGEQPFDTFRHGSRFPEHEPRQFRESQAGGSYFDVETSPGHSLARRWGKRTKGELAAFSMTRSKAQAF